MSKPSGLMRSTNNNKRSCACISSGSRTRRIWRCRIIKKTTNDTDANNNKKAMACANKVCMMRKYARPCFSINTRRCILYICGWPSAKQHESTFKLLFVMNLNNSSISERPSTHRAVDSAEHAPSIRLSDRALQELLRLSNHYSVGQVTRLGVKGGGCAGLSYLLEAGSPQEGDYLIRVGSITLAIEPSHALYLDGLQLDIGEGLNNRGFIFENPNAGSTCGCGTSFSL
ncbi:MAG: iron-sulfur cluster assembly accessory protein [Bacteroidetes bacterium]|nr:iron-sulfur cluster assembly accessory protein [Bacteroidota bacterium]